MHLIEVKGSQDPGGMHYPGTVRLLAEKQMRAMVLKLTTSLKNCGPDKSWVPRSSNLKATGA
jgi:hypothetical protein